jgi:hypothetical protein
MEPNLSKVKPIRHIPVNRSRRTTQILSKAAMLRRRNIKVPEANTLLLPRQDNTVVSLHTANRRLRVSSTVVLASMDSSPLQDKARQADIQDSLSTSLLRRQASISLPLLPRLAIRARVSMTKEVDTSRSHPSSISSTSSSTSSTVLRVATLGKDTTVLNHIREDPVLHLNHPGSMAIESAMSLFIPIFFVDFLRNG